MKNEISSLGLGLKFNPTNQQGRLINNQKRGKQPTNLERRRTGRTNGNVNGQRQTGKKCIKNSLNACGYHFEQANASG